MKLVRFDGGRLGAVADGLVTDITALCGADQKHWPPTGMVSLIASWDALHGDVEKALGTESRSLEDLRLDCPIDWPNKVIAFPANYRRHIAEMGANLISTYDAKGQGFFLKSNSSLSGPSDPIPLPAIVGRETHHECELAIILGKGGRDIPRARAMEHIFGYSCLIDVVVRGKEERVMRKSFDGFCPLGPWIVTADEIRNPADIDLLLSVNGETRQKANTKDLIVDIPGMIEMASSVMTLMPGDVIASGTPDGVGPLKGGDRVRIEIAGVGGMTLDVVQTKLGGHPLWAKD